MGYMAEPSGDRDIGGKDKAWERNSTRQAILDAARRLAARDGAEAITLSRVAAEAGFAPPAVYAYFVSKDDLHLAVVADDLDKLARAMRGDEDEEPVEPESAEADAPSAGFEEAGVIAFPPVQGDVSDDEASEPQQDELPLVVEAQAEDDGASDELPVSDDGAAETDVVGAENAELVSLVEIEQAIGVVLGDDGEDFVEAVPPDEEVPDAFPEEVVDDGGEAEATDATLATAPEAVQAEEKGLRARLRRHFWQSRQEEVQPAKPTEAVEEVLAAPEPEEPETAPETVVADVPADLEQMAAAVAELKQTVARLEVRPVDSWLERRLRVFERTLADIEARMEKVERDTSTGLATLSEGFQTLEARVSEAQEGTGQQASESEQRHRAIVADLRMYVKDLSGRLGSVEASLTRVLGEQDSLSSMAVAARQYVESSEPESDAAPDVSEPATQTAPQGLRAVHEVAGENYLSAARRAAQSSTTATEPARESVSPLKAGGFKLSDSRSPGLSVSLSRRTLQIIAAALTVVVALIALGIALRSSQSADSSVAASRTMAVSPDVRVAELAKAGNANAELVVGLKLMNGDGVSSDMVSAAHWLKLAAAQHQPVAEYWLGTLYERGRGVDKDLAKAMQWYLQAAKAGNVKAMYRLGVGYAEGWAGEPNYADAANWFIKAARLGSIDAQFNLAVLYERGQGVPQSLTKAFEWYSIAAGQGDAVSKSRIDALVSQISPDKVAAAQAEAGKFHPAEPASAANVEPTVRQVAAQH